MSLRALGFRVWVFPEGVLASFSVAKGGKGREGCQYPVVVFL
jgi:hypothetical protein